MFYIRLGERQENTTGRTPSKPQKIMPKKRTFKKMGSLRMNIKALLRVILLYIYIYIYISSLRLPLSSTGISKKKKKKKTIKRKVVS
jgi:hypothetical protein